MLGIEEYLFVIISEKNCRQFRWIFANMLPSVLFLSALGTQIPRVWEIM